MKSAANARVRPRALRADNLLGRHVYDAEVDPAAYHGVRKYLVEYLQIRVAPREHALAVGLLPRLKGLSILYARLRLTQSRASSP